MLTPVVIKEKAVRKWPDFRDWLLKSLILEDSTLFFPLIIRGDTSLRDTFSESAEAYSILLSESKEKKGKGYTLIWEKKNIRGYGTQSVIKNIFIETEEDYFFLTGKEETKTAICSCINALSPLFNDKSALFNWARSHTKDIENQYTDWSAVAKTISYFLDHRDNRSYYLRELPIMVHTKFIEENASLLISLFSAVTGETFNSNRPEDVFRLKRKPLLIRFRMKSKRWIRDEMAIPLTSFSFLDEEEDLSDIKRVFIIENEAVYLSFPLSENDVCVFGGGFQAAVLEAEWMKKRDIYYFGDLDEHGLEILSIFRSRYPKAKSLMMDIETYLTFKDYWVKGISVESENVFSNLTKDELELLYALRRNAPDHSRLEQERISQEYIRKTLSKLN